MCCWCCSLQVIAGFGTLGGKGVAMGTHSGLGRLPRRHFWMSCRIFFDTLQGLLLRCSLVPYLSGIVRYGLLVGYPLGVCQNLGVLLALLLLEVVRLMLLRWCGVEVSWVSGSGLGTKRIRLIRKPLAHLLGIRVLNLGHGCGRDSVILVMSRGGARTIRMRACSCAKEDWGWLMPRSSTGPRL